MASTNTNTGLDPERWLEEHGDALYAYAVSRIHNPTVSEDLVQEVLLAAFKGKERFSGRSSERTWLTGILKHKIIDHFRKTSRERQYEDTETLEAFERDHFLPDGHWREAPSSWPAHPAKSFERKEFWGVLHRCLGRLKPQHQQAFSLRELEGLGSEEICKILGISESNLWVILHRARLRLRECLEKNWFHASEKSA